MSQLPNVVIGIDVETTSLDPLRGEIIEVAAILFDGKTGKELARYDKLCAPKQPLSAEITSITGITQEMVEGKKPFVEHIEPLQEFLADHILFAHNSSFDVGWLTHHGLDLKSNPVWDTYRLASVVWPEAGTYNLGSLAAELGITIESEHRAAADVLLNWEVLRSMIPLLQVTARQHDLITQALTRSREGDYLSLFEKKSSVQTRDNGSTKKTAGKKSSQKEALTSLEDIFGEKGLLQKQISGFQARSEQLQMAQKVQEVLTTQTPLIIEAPTGTGKTYAYLTPLLLHAAQSKKAGIISTYTRHLQDQLMEHDIPRLLEWMGQDAKVVALKGRQNYVCSRRLVQLFDRSTLSADDAWLLVKLLLWLERGEGADEGRRGDMEKLNLRHIRSRLLRLLTADTIACRQKCSAENDCPYHVARQQAETADIVVVNHALLIQEAQNDHAGFGKVVGGIVIDEAHHIEEAAVSASRVDLSVERIAECLAAISSIAQKSKVDTARTSHIQQEGDAVIEDYQKLLAEGLRVVRSHTEFNSTLYLSHTVRRSSSWQSFHELASRLLARCTFLSGLAESVKEDITGKNKADYREALQEFLSWKEEFHRFLEGDKAKVAWLEVVGYPKEESSSFHETGYRIADYIQPLFTMSPAVTFTSATMSVEGNFSYMQERLGLAHVEAMTLPSSFNYRDQMLIYVIDDGPAPTDPSFDAFIGQNIRDISLLTSGRLLGLFTSHKAVQTVYKMLIRPLNKANIRIMAQRLSGGRHNITQRFRSDASSVLLGTNSFWEGVDVPGDSLSTVVIPKLPFPHFSDPQIAALQENLGRSPVFENIIVPKMMLRIRQGVGRLLRSPTDKGVIVLCDKRIVSQDYGRRVMNSLPPATIKIGGRGQMVAAIQDWFGEDTLEGWKAGLQK